MIELDVIVSTENRSRSVSPCNGHCCSCWGNCRSHDLSGCGQIQDEKVLFPFGMHEVRFLSFFPCKIGPSRPVFIALSFSLLT